MTIDVAAPLAAFRFLAAGSVLVGVLVHVRTPTSWTLAIGAVLVAHWASHVWIGRTASERSLRHVPLLPVSLNAVLLTHLHSDHTTDFNDVVTTRWVDERTHRWLSGMAVALIFGMTVLARALGGAGPVHAASTEATRDIVAIGFTPALTGFVAWMAWRNHTTSSRAIVSRPSSARVFPSRP